MMSARKAVHLPGGGGNQALPVRVRNRQWGWTNPADATWTYRDPTGAGQVLQRSKWFLHGEILTDFEPKYGYFGGGISHVPLTLSRCY